jgi:hypothetical protein
MREISKMTSVVFSCIVNQKVKNIQKNFLYMRLSKAFSADHFGKKPFRISLTNGGAMVKIFNRRYQMF